MSLMFPMKGSPGGPGITSVISNTVQITSLGLFLGPENNKSKKEYILNKKTCNGNILRVFEKKEKSIQIKTYDKVGAEMDIA
jgi:hypothetical protein